MKLNELYCFVIKVIRIKKSTYFTNINSYSNKYTILKTRAMKTSNRKIKKISFFALTLASLFFLFAACSKANDPASNQVTIQNNAFSPATLTVKVGTTVIWTNKDGTPHTVTSDTGVFSSVNLNPNQTFSFMFMNKGTFNYHCTIHSNMTAKIVVN